MIGYVYLTTNLVNNKKYIGQHRSSTIDPSYLSNGYSFGRTKFKQFNRVAPPHNKGKTRVIKDGKVTYENK